MRVLWLLFISCLLAVERAACERVVCYYASWAYRHRGLGRFLPSDIEPTVCSHLVYSFVSIGASGEVLLRDPYFDLTRNGLKDFAALKHQNSRLKTLVAVGGASAASTNFSIVAANSTLRSAFAANVLSFIEQYNLDGLDLDWEYPAQRANSSPADKENFVLLVRDLKTTLFPKGYLLTAAVSGKTRSIDISYNVTALDSLLDFINVMTYNMHGPWERARVTGANAPLYPQPSDAVGTVLTVNAGIHAWISRGATPANLNLGLGNFGHAYTLADTSNRGTGAAIVDTTAEDAAPYTGDRSKWTYKEICSDQANNTDSWTIVNANNSYVYAIKNTLWVGYDDPDTMFTKGAYAKETGLGGVMFWQISGDDFQGYCGEKYALIKAAAKGYNYSSRRIRRHLEW